MEASASKPLAEASFRADLSTTPTRSSVAVVVPFLDEAENLPVLISELREVIDVIGRERPVEVVLVDDGSTDGSARVAEGAIGEDERFSVVVLQSNCGKSAAMAAGCDHSTGDIVVTIDADLQDPPAAIPEFVARVDAGADLVAAWRKNRREPLHRRVLSAVFNTVVGGLTGVGIHDLNCGLRAYRRRVLESMYLSPGMHRFTAVVAHAHGFSVAEVPIEHGTRHAGRSKYGLWRYFETSVGILTALYVRRPQRSPMSTMATAGALLLLLGVALAAAVALLPAGSFGERAWVPWLVVGGFVLLAMQLLLCGFVGELILQRLAGAQLRPPYVLRERRERKEQE